MKKINLMCKLMTTTLLVLCLHQSTKAQYLNYLADKDLFDLGYKEYQKENYIPASFLLYAYIQREPLAMTFDERHAASVKKAFKYSISSLVNKVDRNSNIGRITQGLSAPNLSNYPTTYPLVIRGGGDLYFKYEPYSNFFRSPQVWIYFEPSQNKASNKYNLSAGEAAWLDRPISNAEPKVLIIPIPKQSFSISFQRGKVMGISSSLTFLNNLLDEDNFETFQAYNNRQGFFIAVRETNN